jgi:aspartate-semialdehyde dehydrogenase
MEWETSKILGSVSPDKQTGFHSPKIPVSVHCNRVPVLDGHLLSLSLSFAQSPAPTPEQVVSALATYTCEVQQLNCPSAPKQAIVVLKQQDRPQPRLDRMREGGYAISVGRIRRDDTGVFDIKMTVLVHNTVLGAAGSSLLIGEYCVAKGLL